MPVLFAAVILISVLAVTANLGLRRSVNLSNRHRLRELGFAACLYISYNILAMILLVATSSVNAKAKICDVRQRTGRYFSRCVGFQPSCLHCKKTCSLRRRWICRCLPLRRTDPRRCRDYLQRPALCGHLRVRDQQFYGFTTKLRQMKKSRKVILSACLAFLLGLVGFKNVVAYMFPIEGYLGFAIIAMLFSISRRCGGGT